MVKSTSKVRINLGTFDLVKGFLMIGIIVVHMIQVYDLSKFPFKYPIILFLSITRACANATFFYISGFSFKPKSIKAMFKKTCEDLLIPYTMVAVFTVVLLPVVHYLNFGWWPGAIGEGIKYFFSFLLGLSETKTQKVLFGYTLYNCSVAWFLLALFFSHNILNLILKIKKESFQRVVVLCCFVVGYLLNQVEFSYFCISGGLMATGFCYISYCLKKNKYYTRENQSRRLVLCSMFLTIIYVIILYRRHLIGWYGLNLIDVVGMYAGGFFALSCGVYLGQLDLKWLEWVKVIGMHTYWIMCIHSVEIVCLLWYRWAQIMENHQPVAVVIELVIRTIIIGVTCFILKKISKYQYSRRKMRNAA